MPRENQNQTVIALRIAGPLHRAEWVKMIGAFLNLEDKADASFKDTSDRYNQHKANAQPAVSDAAPTKIAWIAHEKAFPPYGIMDGKFVVSFAAYEHEHVADAGE